MANIRRPGCLVIGIIVFIVWLLGGWGLYHASLMAPPKPDDDEDSKPFQIIPLSED